MLSGRTGPKSVLGIQVACEAGESIGMGVVRERTRDFFRKESGCKRRKQKEESLGQNREQDSVVSAQQFFQTLSSRCHEIIPYDLHPLNYHCQSSQHMWPLPCSRDKSNHLMHFMYI